MLESSKNEVAEMIATGTLTIERVRQLRLMTPAEAEVLFDAEYQDLEDCLIGLSDAAKKYDIERATLSRWAKRGEMVQVIHRPTIGRGKQILLDERSVAVAAAMYKLFGPTATRYYQKAS